MARKSKSFGELLKQKQNPKTEQEALKNFEQEIKQSSWLDTFAGVVANPKGEVKMSDVLEEFVEPYLDSVKTHHEREKLFTFAVIAWNIAISPESERQSMIEDVLQAGVPDNDPELRKSMTAILNELIERKQELFPTIKRHILEFKLQKTGKTYHLSVASTLETPPASQE